MQDSPTSKLLYNKEVQGYKAQVKKYYDNVRNLPRIPEDAMQYYLKQLSTVSLSLSLSLSLSASPYHDGVSLFLYLFLFFAVPISADEKYWWTRFCGGECSTGPTEICTQISRTSKLIARNGDWGLGLVILILAVFSVACSSSYFLISLVPTKPQSLWT